MLRIDGLTVSVADVRRSGIGAVKAEVEYPLQEEHRHLRDLVSLVEASDLPDTVKGQAVADIVGTWVPPDMADERSAHTCAARDGDVQELHHELGLDPALAADGHLQGRADLPHPLVAETTDAIHQRRDRYALERIQVGHRGARHRVLPGLKPNLARDSSDVSGAGSYQRAAEPGDGGVTGEYYDRPPADLR
ncbi:MAG: hypothetical protein Kow00129_16340 [Thermoleophilia bacterium]